MYFQRDLQENTVQGKKYLIFLYPVLKIRLLQVYMDMFTIVFPQPTDFIHKSFEEIPIT